jgi:sugar lactone lactonase YvrE
MRTVDPFSDHVSQWGEGPVWWEGSFWWVDIEGKKLNRQDISSENITSWEVGQRIGFALPAENGIWIWGGDDGLFALDPASGTSTPLTDPEPDLPQNRFNDAAVSPDGRLFAGTIAMDKTEGAATLYRLDPGPECTSVVATVTNSNGIGWSPDGKTMYYIDTPTRKIRRFPYRDGDIGAGEIVVDTDPVLDASPDGMCVDAEGHLWVAFCHGGCVIRFHSESGEPLDRIDVPAKETTSCCFGGAELRDLYITTGVGTGDKESDGRVYVVRDMDVRGQKQNVIRFRKPLTQPASTDRPHHY